LYPGGENLLETPQNEHIPKPGYFFLRRGSVPEKTEGYTFDIFEWQTCLILHNSFIRFVSGFPAGIPTFLMIYST
jgi:hypothetical protein